jgi:hypothetical protein
MTTTFWTLECGGVEKSAEAWGVANIVGRFASLATDVVTFDIATDAFDGTAPFTYGAWVSIRYGRTGSGTTWTGGTRWFYGQVKTIPRVGRAAGESIGYTLWGVWSCLERRVFEQPWYVWENNALALSSTSHLFLNVKETMTDGIQMSTTAEQIGAVMDWCIGTDTTPVHAEADRDPIAKGDIPTGIYVPIDEVRDMTCAEVIKKQLRWIPDAVSWVDYSTAPYPTINFVRRSGLSACTFAIGTKPLADVEVTRRDDLLVPAVVLKFERVDETNGTPHFSLTTQIAPEGATGNAPGTFKATIDLKGYSSSYVSADVAVTPIALDSEAWWKAHYPHMTGDNVESVTLISADARDEGFEAYPNELTRGQIADWMTHVDDGDIVGVIGRQESLKATFEIITANATTGARLIERKTETLNIVATNAITQTYTTLETYEAGDPVPAGLAAALYGCLSTYQYAGSITLTEEEINTALGLQGLANRPGVGMCVNLTGGVAEWATMNAMVQQAAVDVSSGTTTLTFGPPDHLGLDDLIELLRVTRGRQVFNNPRVRGGSLSAGSSRVGLGKDTGGANTDGGATSHSYQKVADVDAGYIESDPKTDSMATHKMSYGSNTAIRTVTATAARSITTAGTAIIDLNTADCTVTGVGEGTEIKIRELDYCDNGVLKKIRVVCSAPYDAPS